MELREFQDRIYAKKDGQLYVFESVWDSFRPIERVAWDGERYAILDSKYKLDLFDENYGYGTLAMKATCRQLTQEAELDEVKEIKEPLEFWKWSGETTAKWWFDRACVFASPCVPKDIDEWKKHLNYTQSRAKTIRRPLGGRMTKRLVPK
jgi:hypothetical protein